MKISRNLAIAIIGGMLTASSFAADGVKLAFRLESNGKLLGTPLLTTNFGERASVQTKGDGRGYRIETLTQDTGATVDIALKLFVDEGEGMKLVSEPRLLSPFDTMSSVAYTAKDGATMRLTVQASRAEIPVTR